MRIQHTRSVAAVALVAAAFTLTTPYGASAASTAVKGLGQEGNARLKRQRCR